MSVAETVVVRHESPGLPDCGLDHAASATIGQLLRLALASGIAEAELQEAITHRPLGGPALHGAPDRGPTCSQVLRQR